MAEPYKVMLIDDDKSVHVLMRRIVEDAGYRYCAAYDGKSNKSGCSTRSIPICCCST